MKAPFIIGFSACTLVLAGCDKPTVMPLTVDSYRSNEVNLLVEAVEAGWSMRERGISHSNAIWSARALLENRMTIKQLIEMTNY